MSATPEHGGLSEGGVCGAAEDQPCVYTEDWPKDGVHAGDAAPWVHTFGGRLAARAAAPDALRAGIEGLAAEWEAIAQGHTERAAESAATNRGEAGLQLGAAGGRYACVTALRALLDDPAAAGRAT